MLSPYAAVVVYNEEYVDTKGTPRPSFCVVAHNLVEFEAVRLAKRLERQFEMDAFVMLHRQLHEGRDAQGRNLPPGECMACGGLFEDIIKDAIKLRDDISDITSVT